MINQSNKLSGPFLIDLKNKFREIAGEDNKIDRNEFHKGLALNNEAIVNRIFDIFDKDHNEYIDSDEFITGIESLINGEEEDKIRFAFDIHDFDASGDIDHEELKTLIKNILIENNLEFDVNQIDLIVDEFFKTADLNNSGTIDYKEFLKMVHNYPDLISGLAVNPIAWFNPHRNEFSLEEQSVSKAKSYKVQVQDLSVLQWLLVPRLIYFYNIILNRSKNRNQVGIESLQILPQKNISFSFLRPKWFMTRFNFFKVLNVITHPIINDFVAAAPTNPSIISKLDRGAAKISNIVFVNFGKKIPNDALLML